jgi:tripartite-type tricarboxylate transporter receptor subunit TctC
VLLYTPTSSFTAHPYQHDKLPYDPAELSPVARVSNTGVGFVVAPGLNIASVKELIELIRKEPGKYNYATGTGMTDLIYDGYFKSEGMQITRVSYRDVVAPMTDLSENRIQAYAGGLAIVQPHVAAGRAKLVAVTNSARVAAYPDVPTMADAGFPALTFDGLVGIFGPKDMAQAARDRIATDVRTVVADPTVASRLTATGSAIAPGNSAEFAAALEGQRAKLAAAVKVLGIKGN